MVLAGTAGVPGICVVEDKFETLERILACTGQSAPLSTVTEAAPAAGLPGAVGTHVVAPSLPVFYSGPARLVSVGV